MSAKLIKCPNCGRTNRVPAAASGTPRCGHCRMVSPALEQVATDLASRIKLVKVDVDQAPKLQQRFGVQAIPTLMILRNGQVVARRAGAAPASDLRAWVEQTLDREQGA